MKRLGIVGSPMRRTLVIAALGMGIGLTYSMVDPGTAKATSDLYTWIEGPGAQDINNDGIATLAEGMYDVDNDGIFCIPEAVSVGMDHLLPWGAPTTSLGTWHDSQQRVLKDIGGGTWKYRCVTKDLWKCSSLANGDAVNDEAPPK